MSVITEILERLSGITVVRERLNDTTRRIDKLAEWMLDHEKRLIAIEATEPKLPAPKKRKKK
jgi:hypothetical protein